MGKRVTLFDIADSLGISTGTVHRALHDHPGVNPQTRALVLQKAKALGYRPNLAARYLSQRHGLRISVNTPRGVTSFWEEIHSGIHKEAASLGMDSVTLELRTFQEPGNSERRALESALDAGVDGIILFPSSPELVRPLIRRAARNKIPVVCIATDAPDSGRLSVVSIDTMASGSLAADLMGRLRGGQGKVAVTCNALSILEHAQKTQAFVETLHKYYPAMEVVATIEENDIESEAYAKCRGLFESQPDLAGAYVTTEVSMPVLQAARDTGILQQLTVITTDLYPSLVPEIRSGAVTATIHQRPATQGRTAFRVLYRHLVEGTMPASQVTFAPHLVMRGNMDFFLQREHDHEGPDDSAGEPASVGYTF
jgi:LacI family transcriptional regulator